MSSCSGPNGDGHPRGVRPDLDPVYGEGCLGWWCAAISRWISHPECGGVIACGPRRWYSVPLDDPGIGGVSHWKVWM